MGEPKGHWLQLFSRLFKICILELGEPFGENAMVIASVAQSLKELGRQEVPRGPVQTGAEELQSPKPY